MFLAVEQSMEALRSAETVIKSDKDLLGMEKAQACRVACSAGLRLLASLPQACLVRSWCCMLSRRTPLRPMMQQGPS